MPSTDAASCEMACSSPRLEALWTLGIALSEDVFQEELPIAEESSPLRNPSFFPHYQALKQYGNFQRKAKATNSSVMLLDRINYRAITMS